MEIIPADIGIMILGMSLKATGQLELVKAGELMISISILLLGIVGYGLATNVANP